ncbi:MAG TPA: DNA helicase [Syntrophomonas sp.]|nr:DNA helicase [Syntrophomonas sp.]
MELITDIEAEQRVISALLHSEPACAEAFSGINEDEFADRTNRDVFLLAKSLYTRGVRPTLVEVFKEGHELGWITKPQDLEKIKRIAEQYIVDENIGYWLDRVRQAAKGRKAQELIRKYRHEIGQNNPDIPGLIQRAGADFMNLALDSDSEQIEAGAEVAAFGSELVAATVDKWRRMQEDARAMGETPLEGVPTGLHRLNALTLGYKPGDLILLGAQTGHGKTAFALNTANAVCVAAGQPALYVNTEMSRQQIAYRWGAILAGIPLQKIRTGSLTNEELSQVQAAFKRLADSGFYTSTIPNLTPDKLQILARKAKLQHDIQFLIVDYIGRMEKRDLKLQEWQVLEDIVRACKVMGQNLEIAVMVLVQLNSDGSLQGAKRMKNECDLMLQLLPLDVDDGDDVDKRRAEFQRKYKKTYEPGFNYYLRIDKSRDSESGVSIPLVFDKARQQIREAQEVPDHWRDIAKPAEGGRH